MILRLLRFFNHPLLAQLDRSETEKAILQDRLERAGQEHARLWELTQTAQNELSMYYRMDKNLDWQSHGRPAPFPDAPHLPANLVRQPDTSTQPAHRSQGSQLVAKANRDFKQKTAEKFKIAIPTN